MGSNSSKTKKEFQSVSPLPAETAITKEVSTKSVCLDSSSEENMDKYSIKNLKALDELKNPKDNKDKEIISEQTEGQLRREAISQCEQECSEITKFLYVGGDKVY